MHSALRRFPCPAWGRMRIFQTAIQKHWDTNSLQSRSAHLWRMASAIGLKGRRSDAPRRCPTCSVTPETFQGKTATQEAHSDPECNRFSLPQMICKNVEVEAKARSEDDEDCTIFRGSRGDG